MSGLTEAFPAATNKGIQSPVWASGHTFRGHRATSLGEWNTVHGHSAQILGEWRHFPRPQNTRIFTVQHPWASGDTSRGHRAQKKVIFEFLVSQLFDIQQQQQHNQQL
jgi:hypothetical protein